MIASASGSCSRSATPAAAWSPSAVARSIPAARAKYLNGPDTPLFDKGRVLYGAPEARRLLAAAGDGAPLIVVEGYMDVIACQRAGLAAVAPMGTSLTESQMELLWRLHPEPTLAFDGDSPGLAAASRAVDRALPLLRPGRSFLFALLEGGKDPDEIYRAQGPAALKAQMVGAAPFVDHLFVRERDREVLDTPERRAGLKQRLRAAARTIADADLSAAYGDTLLARYGPLPGRAAGSAAAAPLGSAAGSRRRPAPGRRRAPPPAAFTTPSNRPPRRAGQGRAGPS